MLNSESIMSTRECRRDSSRATQTRFASPPLEMAKQEKTAECTMVHNVWVLLVRLFHKSGVSVMDVS